MIPLRELVGLAGLPRFSPARLALAFGLLIVAVGLAISGFIALVDALYLALLLYLDPPIAKLVIALVLLLLAALLLLIGRRLTRPLPPPAGAAAAERRAAADHGADEALAWVQRHPGQSALLAAVLGFCVGALPEARKVLSELVKTRR